MSKFRDLVRTLSIRERESLMVELLIPAFRSLQTEGPVHDHDGDLVGWLVTDDGHARLVPSDVVDRLRDVDPATRRAAGSAAREFESRVAQEA